MKQSESKKNTDLSICIVSYNVCSDLKKCLASVKDCLGGLSHEVIVVDNASKDNTKNMVAEDFPDVLFMGNTENLGFAKANNMAYLRSSGSILLFLNPDTIILQEGFKENLKNFREKEEVGAMGPKLLNADGSYQRGSIRRFPGPLDAAIRMTFLRKIPLIKDLASGYRMPEFDPERSSYVEQISGAAFFVKRDVFESVGLFDENFFIFYEEVDLCLRIWNAEKKIAYEPGMQIVHTGGQSRKKENGRIRCINIRSLLWYFQKHLSGVKKIVFFFFFKLLFMADLVIETLADALMSVFPYTHGKKSDDRLKKKEFRRYFVRNCFFAFLFKW